MAEPDFSFMLPKRKGSTVVNPDKDRSLRGKARRQQRRDSKKSKTEPGASEGQASEEPTIDIDESN